MSEISDYDLQEIKNSLQMIEATLSDLYTLLEKRLAEPKGEDSADD